VKKIMTRKTQTLPSLPRLFGVFLVLFQATSHAEDLLLAELRSRLEGTWQLVEWHVDGEVLHPPQVGGRWSNHDGVVMFTAFRNTGNEYESLAGYGSYEIDVTTWSYSYEGMQITNGANPEDAKVVLGNAFPLRSFEVTRRGDAVLLDRPDDHREYEGDEFRLLRNGTLLRKWRRIR
jgi:hypothetical protein